MASWMSWLPPGFASTLLATPTRPLLTGQAIRGWRFRGNRRILLLQGELTFEIGNAFRLLLELFAKAFVLLAQPFDLVRRVGTRVARGLIASRSLLPPSHHRRERTKSLRKVQVQNRAKCQGLNCYPAADRAPTAKGCLPPGTARNRPAPAPWAYLRGRRGTPTA
jgi:hypothetical protein